MTRWSPEKEAILVEALNWLDSDSMRTAAGATGEFNLSRSLIRRRRAATSPPPPRVPLNLKLIQAEETSLLDTIFYLDNFNLSPSKKWITNMANIIIKERSSSQNPSPNYVGPRWVDNFLKRHNLSINKTKNRDKKRTEAEDHNTIEKYFNLLQEAIAEHGITPDNIWNMDETGFMIGHSSGGCIVTQRRKYASKRAVPLNRELATAIEAISATGDFVKAPFLVVASKLHLARWYRDPKLPDNGRIAITESGYSNDYVALEWLKFFEEQTRQRGSSIKRLLIIDGHSSHETNEFLQYAKDHNIVLFGLPPHCTHLLQPLDVVIFFPFKHFYSEAINKLIMGGIDEIQKLEFLAIINHVRQQTMKEKSIKSAFRKTGIWPYFPDIILEQIRELHPEQFEAEEEFLTPPPLSACQSAFLIAFSHPVLSTNN
ncbi:hypothetical protein IF2G_10587 [Cordyceps javanica]|nr:hypothetical protein IF2G_10587 [Cordyceps javanica]